ncbi:MAG: hypothetical protein ABR976_10370 [Terracidiphilus sp.]|jgi:hypothetical protein
MPGLNDRINAVLATTQNLFTVLRDVFIAALLVFLLGFPTQLNSTLSKAGITQLNGGVFTWQQAQQAAAQGTAAAQASSSASDTLDEVKSTLEDIASKSSDPNIQKEATDAANQAAGSLASLDTASNSLAQSVLTLQTTSTGAPSPTQASPTAGWVLLGNADSTHQTWTKATIPKIASASPDVSVGQVVKFSDNVFLRADKSQSQSYDQAPILGAVRSGSTAVVTDVAYVPNKRGNAHVWVKVNMKSNA